MFDELTELGNSRYLEQEYLNYIKANKSSNLIMLDFSNFKKINDTYGHEIGDKCLKSFAEKIKIYFKNSLLTRLHGDEFCIVTSNTEKSIRDILELIDLNIKAEVESGVLPLKFGFNAGSTPVTEDLKDTQAKADYMMYYAKMHKLMYKPFVQKIYQQKINENNILKRFIFKLNTESFTYYGRNLHDINDQPTNTIQIHTKDIDGSNILNRFSYATLRKNSQISKFDMFNLQNLISKTSMIENDNDYIINIDYRSLLSVNNLINFLKGIKNTTLNGLENIIISIDICGIESNEYGITADMVKLLSDLGFRVKLDKIDNKIADCFIENTNPSFISISTDMWKKSLAEDKIKLLKSKINTYKLMGDNIVLIFEKIDSSDDKKILQEISPVDTLYSGEYFSKEKKLLLY